MANLIEGLRYVRRSQILLGAILLDLLAVLFGGAVGLAGRLLLTVVVLYGACIVVCGLSRFYPLSLAALAVSGFVDLYSMNIRSTTVALASPNRLRGRVNAVEMVFISASNQLGYFESGLAASLVGTIPAVVGGVA